MKKYQKIILGLFFSSTLLFGKENFMNKFAIYKVEDFSKLRSLPAFSMGAPSGMAVSGGVAYMAFSGITDSTSTDGGLSLGVGYGKGEKIGGGISLGIGSINPLDGGAFNRGSLHVSAGHNFYDKMMGISVGMNSLSLWHHNGDDHDDSPTFYLAGTKLFPNDLAPMALTVGIGNNNFAKIDESGDKKDNPYPFVSGAIYVMPQLSLIADYTSKVTTLGVGLVPFPELPITMVFGLYDITKERDKEKTSFVGALAVCVHI